MTQTFPEEISEFLPDLLLKEMKIGMICPFNRKKSHIAACFLQLLIKQLTLSKRYGMIIFSVNDQERRRFRSHKAHRTAFQRFPGMTHNILSQEK